MYKLKVKLYINTPLQQVVHLVQHFIHQRANLVCKTFNTLEHEHYGLSTNLQLHIDNRAFRLLHFIVKKNTFNLSKADMI